MSDSQFAEGCQLLVQGKYQDAAQTFHEMLLGGGDHPSLRYNLGLSLECCKKFQDAAAQYSTVIREYPEYPPAYLGMANCYFYEGDVEHCEGMLCAAREADPTDPRAAILLSEVLLMRGSEKEGIAQHLEALRLIDDVSCSLTDNHALCYGDFGIGGQGYYSFWETSLLQRGFPPVPQFNTSNSMCIVILARAQNAADVARRIQTLPREKVFLVTLDGVTQEILSDYAPEMHLACTYEDHELPALHLHIGNFLLKHPDVTAVLLPADDCKDDLPKMEWAEGQLANGKTFAVHKNGDLMSSSPLDARRLPPLLNKGQHAARDTFAKIFSVS